MGEKTAIGWCHYTWNPWRGCEEVSPGCANCYAREFARRSPALLGEWGKGSLRVIGSESYMEKIEAWNRRAIRLGVSARVFVGSMMDFFECREDLILPRHQAFYAMRECENLEFLILTKRSNRHEAF